MTGTGARLLALVALALVACGGGVRTEDRREGVSVPPLESVHGGPLDLLREPDGLGQDGRQRLGRAAPLPWYSRATRGEDDSAAREELQVTKVVKDDGVNYGIGVRKWHSLVVGSTTYLVGLGLSDLTLVTYRFVTPDVGSGQTYSYSERHISTGGSPLAATLFKHWNAATKALEAILVFSVKGNPNLMWYRLTDQGEEAIRLWPVHKTITFLKVFQVGEQMKLVMLTSCESKLELVPCDYAAVFEFSVGAPLDAKLSQTLTMEGEAVSAEIGAVGDEVFLAFALPEPGVVKLFRYHWPEEGPGNNSTHGWFESWRDIPSPAVTHAIFFHVSYKTYLAVGGAKPAVLRFVSPTRMEGCPKALQHIGFVSTWLVLPVQTYRDEIILLAEVEHSIDSAPFKGVVTLTWASVGVFNWQYQPPCYVRGMKSTVEGVSCIISESAELGLRGSVAVQLGDATVVKVLVPGGARPSSMYTIETQLHSVVNPLRAEILLLKEAQDMLKAEIMRQDMEIQNTESLLLDSLSARGQNVIKAEWIIEEVETEEHDLDGPLLPTIPSSADRNVDLDALQERLTELRTLTDELLHSLLDAAVPENDELHLARTTILGGLEILGESSFDSLETGSLNGESVPALVKDVVRRDRLDKIGGTKILQKLLVTEIEFSTVNKVPHYDLVFNTPNQTIQVDGNVEFTDILHVAGGVDLPPGGTFGGIDLSEEVLVPGREFKGTVVFDEVTVEGDLIVNVVNTVDMTANNLRSIASGVNNFNEHMVYNTLLVDGQLQVDKVNGFLWSDIARRIVWKDVPDTIENFTSIAGVLKSSAMRVHQLNNLDYPNDYVLKSTGNQHITGRKVFQNQLVVGSAVVTNTVDAIPVNDLITLETDQILDGSLKLKEANISGDVKVEWAVNGVRMNQMQGGSPLIGPGTVVSSNVAFSHLEVVGPIQIASTLNERNFKNDLLDIVVLPSTRSEPVHIGGKKVILGNLEVGGNGITVGLVNNRKTSDMVRLDAAQEFNGKKTISNAVFGTLHLKGRWDGVDVVNLNADAVRLTGVQDTNTRLTFAYPAKLLASRLMISEQINTVMAATVLSSTPNVCDPSSKPGVKCVLKGPVTAQIFRVGGNVKIDGKVCGWHLLDFERRRVSRSRPQTIIGSFSFKELTITNHVRLLNMNSKPISTLGSTDPALRPGFDLESGDFTVDELYIDGNIFTDSHGVNSVNLTLLSENAVKLHTGNTFLGSLVFEDALSVGTLVADGHISGLNFAFLVQDAVLKTENPITISGQKTFQNGFVVGGDIQTTNLNGLDPSKIITKFLPATVAGPLRVLGKVYAGNVNLTGFFNGIPVSSFLNRYQLVSEGRHLLKGNAHFLAGVAVVDLFVMGTVSGTQLEDFFASVVMKDEPARIKGTKHFANGVVFVDVDVGGLVNNISLSEQAMDVVLHNDDKPVTVNGKVTFSNRLTTRAGVSLSGNLDAAELDGCLIKEWLDNAIYLNQDTQIYGLKKFSSMSSGSDLKLAMLNAVDLSKVITLTGQQDIPANVNIIGAALRHNLKVDGKVNNRHLPEEYENTLLVTGSQEVTGSKTFVNGLTVTVNVVLNGRISGRDIRNVVTLSGDEIIIGPLRFSNMKIFGDLHAGLISGIDVQNWRARALLKNSPVEQKITGVWDVKGLVRLLDNARGEGLLDGENVHTLEEYVSEAREVTRRMQNEVKADWVQLCHDTDALLQKARAQPFLFQQIESVQAIQASQTIASMHAFEALNEQFLAVSYSSNCSGAMYRWNRYRTAWELLDGAVQNIGSVERWATLRNAGSTYLVTSATGSTDCPYQGGNIWRFTPDKTSQLRNVQTLDAWHGADVNEKTGHLHLLGSSGVETWSLEDGAATNVGRVPLPDTVLDRAQFLPRSAGLGLSVSDGKSLVELRQGDNNTQIVSQSTNSNLPGRSQGNLVTMKIADGRKLVAVSAEGSNLLVVYEDVATGRSLATVQVNGAHSLSVLELTAPGRNGQTLLAFIENETLLRVVQYKGVEGFVDVTKAKLAVSVKEMIPVRLHARVFVNPRHFLLLRSDRQILSLEVEMMGDPLDEPALTCSIP